MKKHQNGFSVVELFIIIAVLMLLGFVGWSAYNQLSGSKSSASVGIEKPTALLYAYFDGLTMKINSYELTSGSKKQLVEQSVSEPDTRSRPTSVLDAKVSPDKRFVAYRFGGREKIKMMKSDGTAQADVSRSNVRSFTWLAGKRQLLLEVSNDRNCNGADCEAPLRGRASDWCVYDVVNSKETTLNTGDTIFNSLSGQAGNTLYFAANSPYGGVSPQLYAYDMSSRKISDIKLPGGEGIQIGFVSGSPNGERAIMSLLPSDYGTDYRCTIYELKGNKLGDKLVDDDGYQCESAYWTNNDAFYFDKSTGPDGKTISGSYNTASGYDVLLSVYRYDFSGGQQKRRLVSDGSEVYRLLSSLPDGSFVVSNEANKRTPRYKLEIRNADGSLKDTVHDNPKEMSVIGSVR